MDADAISEVLLKRNKKICTLKDILALTSKATYLSTLSKLINSKWIIPIKGFRGVYYVVDPEEHLRSYFKLSNFQVLIKVLNAVLGNEWYFGRMSALNILGLIHQPVSTYYVINKKFSKEFTSRIFGKIILVNSSAKLISSCGILTKKYKGDNYKVCTVERNMADYLYFYVHGHSDKEQIENFYKNYIPDKKKVINIIARCYPKESAIKMKTAIGTVVK